jgi:hypothetical protein
METNAVCKLCLLAEKGTHKALEHAENIESGILKMCARNKWKWSLSCTCTPS